MQGGRRHIRKRDKDQEVYTIKNNRNHKNGDWRWFHSLMVIGWFTGLFTAFIFYDFAVLNWWNLSKIFLIAPIIFLLVPFKIAHRKWAMHFSEWLAFCLLGAGPFLGTFYLISALILSSPMVEKRELIISKERESREVVLQFESQFLEDQPRYRTLHLDNFTQSEVAQAQVVIYQYKKGYLGVDFIMDLRLE